MAPIFHPSPARVGILRNLSCEETILVFALLFNTINHHQMSDDDEAELRRRRLLIARARAEVSPSASSSSSSSEEESESEPARLKPVFVPQSKRAVSVDDKSSESEDSDFAQRQRERVLQSALLDQEPQVSETWSDLQPKAPPIGDEDTEENYQKWKLRELKRILRYRTGADSGDGPTPSEETRKQHGVFFR